MLRIMTVESSTRRITLLFSILLLFIITRLKKGEDGRMKRRETAHKYNRRIKYLLNMFEIMCKGVGKHPHHPPIPPF